MISHFLGVSQTLILKGGHTGSTFSKILGNSHWISPESGFSLDASTPLSPKLWGKSMFATQEWGGGVSHTWAIRVCAKLCSLRRFITEPGKRGAFPFWQLLSGTGSQIQFAWKKFSVKDSAHYPHRVPPGVPQHRDTLAIADRKIYTCIQRDTTPILPLSLPDQGCLWNRSKILKSLFHARL